MRIYKGSFYKGKIHGICTETYEFGYGTDMNKKCRFHAREIQSEWRKGKYYGLGTLISYEKNSDCKI